jgi:hypothetical protein
MVDFNDDEEQMIPLAEAARQRGISLQTLHGAMRWGNLPAEKRGRDWFVKLSDLDAALAAGKIRPGQTGRPRKKPPTE